MPQYLRRDRRRKSGTPMRKSFGGVQKCSFGRVGGKAKWGLQRRVKPIMAWVSRQRRKVIALKALGHNLRAFRARRSIAPEPC